MTPVRIAIPPVGFAIVGSRVGFVRIRTLRRKVRIIADAVREGVIGADGHTAGCAALNVEEETVVTLRGSIIKDTQRSDQLTVLWPFETQPAALIGVCC